MNDRISWWMAAMTGGLALALVANTLTGCLGGLELARNSRTPYAIVASTGPTPAEQCAAEELSAYLEKITGARFAVISETNALSPERAIYVGWTDYARNQGLDGSTMGEEEWVVKSVGKNLVLTGGRPRGTLYAAYRFLEDVLDVHWWNPWEETVPRRPTLKLAALDRRGSPTFRYRDVFSIFGHDGGRFAARNRLNRDGDTPIASKYGGSMAYGPPYHCHTFALYFPEEHYAATHPEWFALIDGKRVTENVPQLCLTNPDLRQAFLAKLRENIAASWAEARAANLPPPLVFDVSPNDTKPFCQCEACQAIAKAEGSESGPLLDFVNFLADGIKEKYPEVFIDTLAYLEAQKPPKTIKCRGNVMVRLSDTQADMLKPVTAPANKAFHDILIAWSKICPKLRVWDYAITFNTPVGMPMPTTHTYGPDYRFYASNGVEGVFTELQYPLEADMRDFKIWTMLKTLENANADYERLTDTFMKGHYGPAGKWVKAYLRALEKEAEKHQDSINWEQSSPLRMGYMNLDFITRAHRLFDKAEKKVKNDAVLLLRVRFARLPLDRATLIVYPKLMGEWLAKNGKPDGFPFDREAIGIRALDTWRAQIDMRVIPEKRAQEKIKAEGSIKRFVMIPGTIAPPEKFRDRPAGSVHDYPAPMTRNAGHDVKLVEDTGTETGFANRLDLTVAKNQDRYGLPMPWGIYGTVEKENIGKSFVKSDDIVGPGYHWYKMGEFPVTPACYVYFFWSCIVQLDVDNVFDPTKPDRKFEFWARIKFEGPRFPHSKPGQTDAICIERVVLVGKNE